MYMNFANLMCILAITTANEYNSWLKSVHSIPTQKNIAHSRYCAIVCCVRAEWKAANFHLSDRRPTGN